MKKIILNRFLKIDFFLGLEPSQKTTIIDAFYKGTYTWKQGWDSGIGYIRPKKEKLNLKMYSDSDLLYWMRRILGMPLIVINCKKNKDYVRI
jgi:hypothetical protein